MMEFVALSELLAKCVLRPSLGVDRARVGLPVHLAAAVLGLVPGVPTVGARGALRADEAVVTLPRLARRPEGVRVRPRGAAEASPGRLHGRCLHSLRCCGGLSGGRRRLGALVGDGVDFGLCLLAFLAFGRRAARPAAGPESPDGGWSGVGISIDVVEAAVAGLDLDDGQDEFVGCFPVAFSGEVGVGEDSISFLVCLPVWRSGVPSRR